jgi:PTS system mannose-specific IIB component/fructoselysine and glucoselysine-specific PTS system IIB component
MLVLLRIDERLIHGQVVVGWGAELRPDHYVVVDDDLTASEWEQELYQLGLPENQGAEFVTVGEARARMGEWDADERRVVLLTKDLVTMAALASGGALSQRKINLGGIHHAPGREEYLPYLHMDATDLGALKTLQQAGARVTAQDLPSTKERSFDHLVAGL